jgi:16S rRNA (guanine527-N7)-methyltransferase
MITWLQPYWNQFDRLLTIKGPTWIEERGEARHLGLLGGLQLRKLDEYPVVGHDATSVILQIRKEERSET